MTKLNMKTSRENLYSMLNKAEGRINYLEGSAKVLSNKRSKKKKVGRRGRKLTKKIVARNVPNLGRDLDILIYEANGSSQKSNSK